MNPRETFIQIMNQLGVQYREYLEDNDITLAGILITTDNRTPVRYECLFGDCNQELLQIITDRGLIDSTAGYYSNSSRNLGIDIGRDLLICSDWFLEEPEKRIVATLLHEACHTIIDNTLSSDVTINNNARNQAIMIRQNFPPDFNGHHCDDWFAYLYLATNFLLADYDMLVNHKDFLECALYYDLNGASLNNVDWLDSA